MSYTIEQPVQCPCCGRIKKLAFMFSGDGHISDAVLLRCSGECGKHFAARVVLNITVQTQPLFGEPEPEPPALLEPDWDAAPAWAQWWAVDSDGNAYWYEGEPYTVEGAWNVDRSVSQMTYHDRVTRPILAVWRATLRQRPASEGTVQP